MIPRLTKIPTNLSAFLLQKRYRCLIPPSHNEPQNPRSHLFQGISCPLWQSFSNETSHTHHKGMRNPTAPRTAGPVVIPPLPSLSAKNKMDVTRDDIMHDYEQKRLGYLAMRREVKEKRRLDIGPYGSITFMNYDILWLQIHEMLHIEQGGEAQIQEELEAYNPIIPKGKDLTITFMLQYPDAKNRTAFLSKLGHIEKSLYLSFGDHKIYATNASNVEETTTSAGKTSAIHFLRFSFTDPQIADFKKADSAEMGIEHKGYQHFTRLSRDITNELKKDFAT
eukprot:TRINITY_DN8263_c0_g1_i1.p1 TRINITY_DN8263_c0_g1~~TRINITY_DN8263_c0_g1_i1.p1  ORF type:complete len:280 (+),score=52.71 TRINITY_DN8263_c0_g1_i1:86-925(+)